jgi:hypothetical protein
VRPGGVVPVDPQERRQFELFDGVSRSVEPDQFGLVQPDQRLSERVVVGVADATDAREGSRVGEPFAVDDAGVLPWEPASEWCTNPRMSSSRRARRSNAISRASSGRAVGIDDAHRHPTILREYTSTANAVYAVCCHVET